MPKSFKLTDVMIEGDKIGLQFDDDKGESLIILYNMNDGNEVGRLKFSFSK